MMTLVTSAALAALAAGAADAAPFPVETGAFGKPIAAPSLRSTPGKSAYLMGRPAGDRNLVEEPDAIVHAPTGVRLPRIHEGCRLAAMLPVGGVPNPYARGALAAYDCSPSQTLTHVEISFEGGSALLRSGDLGKNIASIGSRINQGLTGAKSICGTAAAGSDAPEHAGLLVSHCFSERESSGHTFGATTSVFARGKSFIRFSRKCVDEQCEASLPAFDKFLETFDARAFSEMAARQ